MHLFPRIAVLTLLLTASYTAYAQDAPDTSAKQDSAEAAAEDWLALVDSAAYDDSWQKAAPVFQSGIGQDQWAQTLQQVSAQVGSIENRMLQDSQYRTTLPNAPEGEYVVLQYVSSFERLPQAMEMVVMTKTGVGDWQAAGYQVVPAQQAQQPQQGQPQPQDGQQPQDGAPDQQPGQNHNLQR